MKKYMSKVLSLHQPAKIMTGNLNQGNKEISMDMLNLDQIQQQGMKLAIKDLEMQHYWEAMEAETESQPFPKFCKILGKDPKEGPGSHEECNIMRIGCKLFMMLLNNALVFC
ncbi:hypothetical protein Salat_2728300 [Sesamum alatum]|uniref:Uncharacterized protein n=1 Tax=Sesamum alatum TaxID=300844 RepID=A0AAE1XKL1_9LAMI|nr:hypothetical protein Salat_2728300 [Sesamum alatum]